MVVARSSLEIPADMRLFGKSDSLNYLVPVSRKLDVKIKGGSLTQWDEASGVFQGGIGGRNISGTILQRIPETPVPTKNLLRRKILRFFRNKAAKPSSKPTKLDFDSIELPTTDPYIRYYGFKQKYGDVSTVDPANAGRATLGRDGTNILEKRQLEEFIKKTNEGGEYNVRLIDDGDYRVFSIEKI